MISGGRRKNKKWWAGGVEEEGETGGPDGKLAREKWMRSDGNHHQKTQVADLTANNPNHHKSTIHIRSKISKERLGGSQGEIVDG